MMTVNTQYLTDGPPDLAAVEVMGEAWLAYTQARAIAGSSQDWADVMDTAATWAHAARAWLAQEHDSRCDLKTSLIVKAMEGGASRTAAEKVMEEHPEYRAAVNRMREAERTVALAEARQRHADLRARAALPGEKEL
jgi:hypothetical protein